MKQIMSGVFIFGIIAASAATIERETESGTHLRIFANKNAVSMGRVRDETAKAYGVPIPLFRAIEIIESSGGKHLKAYGPAEKKYAKRLQRRKPAYVRLARARGWTLEQLSTSYGPMHVLGVNYYEKGYSPSDTNNAELNYELAGNYLYKCSIKHPTWRKRLLCFNGGADLNYPIRVAKVAIALGLKSKKA